MRKLLVLAVLVSVVGLLHWHSAAAASTHWVNDDAASYSPPGTDCNNAGYATIQAAVNAAAAGDTINVCPGTYSENVQVTKALIIASTGGAGVTTVNAAASDHVFRLLAAGTTLKGFRVKPAGTADGDIGINLAVEGVARAQILENVVTGGRIGINLGCAADNSIVAKNTLSGQTEAGINIDTCEVAPFPGSDGNQVYENTACGETSTGSIAMGGSVQRNNVHHNIATRISVFGTNNLIHNNTTAVPIVDGGSNILQNNVVDPTVCQRPQYTIVWECFELQEGDTPNVPIRLQTKNFGWDGVTVGQAVRMCEPALKTRGPTVPGRDILVLPNMLLNLVVLDPAGTPHTLMLAGAGALQLGGPDTMPVELVAMDLQSVAPISPRLRSGPPFFDIYADVTAALDPAQHSGGRIDSFFDIFTELTLERQDGRGSLTLKPDGPLHFGPPDTEGKRVFASSPPGLLNADGTQSEFRLVGGSLTLDPPFTRVVECYRIGQGADPNDPYELRTQNFGRDQVIVRVSTSFCEGAIKSREAPPRDLLPPPLVWQCFSLAQGDAPAVPVTLRTRNFGLDEVTVRRLVTLCEDARKVRPQAGALVSIGEPTGRVYACYQIAGKDPRQPYILTTRNFGPDRVIVRRSNLMCEPARKTALFGNPAGEENVPMTNSADR